jgi:hypothetical protein
VEQRKNLAHGVSRGFMVLGTSPGGAKDAHDAKARSFAPPVLKPQRERLTGLCVWFVLLSMKLQAATFRYVFLTALLLTCGCSYHGALKTSFYKPSAVTAKIPIKANLVYGTHLEGSEFTSGVYIGHTVNIKTHPALQQVLTETCQSLFDSVEVTGAASANNSNHADIIIIPNLEMLGRNIKLNVIVKNANTHETIQKYEAVELVRLPIPVSVHCLGALNIMCCGLLIPVYPINAQLLGVEAKDNLETRLLSCLNRITQDIRNDEVLLTKSKSK